MVQSPIDLIHCVPQDLMMEATEADLLATVERIETWTERHADVLDYIYRHRLVRMLSRAHEVSEIEAFQDHLGRVAHPTRTAALASLAKPYIAIWRAYASLLESRIVTLESVGTPNVLERTHVPEILAHIAAAGGRISQNVLREALGLKKANLTRILNLLEANEIIVRRGDGRENRIEFGAKAPAELRKTEVHPPSPDETKRPTSKSKTQRGLKRYLTPHDVART